MKRFLLILLLLPSPLFAVIHSDNAVDGGNVDPGTSLSWSHTSSGSDLLGVVGFIGDAQTGNDDISSVTWGAVTCTLVVKYTTAGTAVRFIYLYQCPAIASGAQTVIITTANSHYISGGSVSYNGAASMQPDTSTSDHVAPSGTSLTTSTTTTNDKDFLVAFSRATVIGISGTGIVRKAGGTADWGLADSLFGIHPAGSASLTITSNGSVGITTIMASIVPVSTSGGCTGASPNWTASIWEDVAECIYYSSNGDTITVSAGSYAVASAIEIDKAITLSGTGVTLTDNTCVGSCGSPSMITIVESAAGNIRLQGFTIIQGSAYHQAPAGVIEINPPTGKPVVIQNMTFGTAATSTAGMKGEQVISISTHHGVIANNYMYGWPAFNNTICQSNVGFIHSKIVNPNPVGWEVASSYGSADTTGEANLYIENNHLYYTTTIDADDLTRAVVRNNYLYDTDFGAHGADTSDPGHRHSEVYGNTFVYSAAPANMGECAPNVTDYIFWRGGTGKIWNNVIPAITGGGIYSASNAIMFVDWKLRRNAGPYGCWNVLVNAGSGYPDPRLVGWGYSTGATSITISGGSSSGSVVHQDLEPVYLWGNTGTGNYGQPNADPGIGDYPAPDAACGVTPDTVANYIHKNREFYTQNASIDTTQGVSVGTSGSRPGTCTTGAAYFNSDLNRLDVCTATNAWGSSYAPFTYPHPLVVDAANTSNEYAYRWRNDDGTESTATTAANNAILTTTGNVAKRLRVGVNTTGSIGASQFQLEWKRSTDADSAYTALTVPQPITITSGTTIPANVYSVSAKCIGGGGAGASLNTSGVGGGGKGGSYAIKTVAVTPGQSVAFTVGAAGTAGASPAAGGQTSIVINGTTACQAAGGNSAAYNSASGATGINGSNVGDTTANGTSGTDGAAGTSGAGGIPGDGSGTGGIAVNVVSNGNSGVGVGTGGSGAKATSAPAADTFTVAGSAMWMAPATLTGGIVTLEEWGAGGAGGTRTTTGSGGGGKGGGYSKCIDRAITPGNNYSYTVGGHGTTNTATQSVTNGAATTFSANTGTCIAAGGLGVINNTATGATAANGTSNGDVTHTGGNGADGVTGTNGGGGGGSAGDTTNGGNASGATGGTAGTSGGTAGATGSTTTNGTGTAGGSPGAGGSGSRRTSSTRLGGNGGDGKLIIEYQVGGPQSGGAGNAGYASLTYTPAPQITLSASANIAASAATATTAQLTPPSGKTTASFAAGRISDDTNPLPSLTPGADQYTENEWTLVLDAAHVSDGESFNFRVTRAGVALDTYGVTPTVTIGNGHTISIETAANGSGSVTASQNVEGGASGAVTAYCIERDDMAAFVSNNACTWSLTNKTGSVVDGDLVPSMDFKSAVFTGNALGTAKIHVVFTSFTGDSGTLTVSDTTAPTPGNSGTITVGSFSTSHILLNWTAATDLVSPQNALQYQVYRSLADNINTLNNAKTNGTIQHSYSTNIASFDVTGPQITCGTNFYFAVLVKDGAGVEAYYPSISQVTSACTTQAPGSATSRIKVKK